METRESPDGILDYNELRQILKKRSGKDLAALEIGCQVPLYLFDIHVLFGSERLVGVDILKTEEEMIDRYVFYPHNIPVDGCKSIKCCYERFLTWLNQNPRFKDIQPSKYLGRFEDDFEIITSFDIRSSRLDDLGKFDLILLVDLLHFMDFKEAMEVIRKIPFLLNDEGVVAIRVNHEQNKSMTDPNNSKRTGRRSYISKHRPETVHLFDEYGFKTLIGELKRNGIEDIIAPEKHLNDDNSNSIKSMSYVGKKTG